MRVLPTRKVTRPKYNQREKGNDMKKWICDGCENIKPVLNDEWGNPVCEDCDPKLHAQTRLAKSKVKVRLVDENLRGLM